MRLLIIGGTLFLGRHIVVSASERGHELTLFNRGRTDPSPIGGVEQIHGDREHDLSLLADREWDAVIDTSGYLPRVVAASAELLAGAVDRYVFVSSVSAYGPAAALTLGPMLERVRVATGNRAELVWVPEEGLAGAGVAPWDELPLWLDLPRNPEFRGFLAVDVGRAVAAGLAFRPLEDTVADTLAWVRTRDAVPRNTPGVPLEPAGLAPDREAELLARLAG